MAETRQHKTTKGQLHKALNEVLKELSEEDLMAGVTIQVLPPTEGSEEETITIQVNWNS